MSLAAHLQAPDLGRPAGVRTAAGALHRALAKVKVHGGHHRPWPLGTASTVRWDFRSRDLAMTILLPDPRPARSGRRWSRPRARPGRTR